MRKKNPTPAPSYPKAALSTKEAAAYLSISLPTLFRLTRGGELPHLRIGRSIRYRLEDLEAFLAARTTTKWEDFNPDRKRPAPADPSKN